MVTKTAEEERRGCRAHSKIYPVALEVADHFRAGKTYREIAEIFAEHEITVGMVAGYLDRNNIRRATDGDSAADIEAAAKREQARKDRAMAKNIRRRLAREKDRVAALVAAKTVVKEPMTANPSSTAVPIPQAPKLRVITNPTGGQILLSMDGRHHCWMHVGPEPRSPADQLFCGARTGGGLFCEEHAAIAYMPKENRRRRAA